MNAIMLDDELRAKLNGLNKQTMLTDEDGTPVGVFLPTNEYRKLILDALKIPLSDQEAARRRQEKTGRSLEDIWKRLGAR